MNSWREKFAPHIHRVLEETKGKPEREIKRALRDLWSKTLLMGERSMWPYKVWCDEVKRQRGCSRKPMHKRFRKDPNQMELAQ